MDDTTTEDTFDTLGLRPEVLTAVRDVGYTHPTPIQRDAIPLALRGRDLIGLAQTGTGKTAAFTLPIIDRLLDGPQRTRALILTPTRELAAQVEESCTTYSRTTKLTVAAVYGGVALEPQEKKLRHGVDIVGWQIHHRPGIPHRRMRRIRVVEERLAERIDIECRNHHILPVSRQNARILPGRQ